MILRRVCAALGIDDSTQQVKLKGKAWATTGFIPAVDASGKVRIQFCIDLDSLPMWLATIEPSRVSEDIRPTLSRYQVECARVLRDYFFGQQNAEPAPYRPWAIRFRESFAPHSQEVLSNFPPGSFTVITEGVMQMLMLEDELIRHIMEVRPGDRPCVSIGLTWSHYRKNTLKFEGYLGEAPIWLPDVGLEVPVKVYSGAELHHFKTWINFTYLPEKLQQYLDRKPEFRQYGSLPRASVADNTCRSITGRPAALAPAMRRLLSANSGFAPASLRPPGARRELPPGV